nr:retrovirus-related Pol polyprotein from transposon TNT 1-94 [Tanacetum cinerariifolium]
MSKQCTKPKRKWDDAWFKDKVLLNLNSSAQQDALILSVIYQLKTQVINCTKINLDNKVVNDTLTAELERYKEQVKVLKEGQNVEAITIPDSKETLMLAEESHSKMILKQQDRMSFVYLTRVEVPKELPKVSMVNTSLKKLTHHLAGFDVVVKERTMATAITEGSLGFEHTKACFRDEIIPFVKALKEIFNTFDQYFIDELTEKKGLIVAAPRDELKKLKGKALVDNAVTTHTIAPKMLQIDMEPLAPRLLNNRTVHSDYLRLIQEQAAILKEFRRVKLSTSASGSQPLGNTKKDRIQQPPSSTQKNKVEAHPKTVKSSLENKNCAVEPKETTIMHHSKLNANYELICVKCNGCMLSDNHDLCVLNVINDVIARCGYNLFFVGQFCDSNLEVAFRQHTYFIRNTEGVDLLTGSRGNNLYALSLGDMMASSPICLLSMASKTKSWLWHRRLFHLNFGSLNHLARHNLARGLPKLKFVKDHLCSACAMGKSKKKTHKHKSEDTDQEKLYLLHMDLYGLMCVASVNEKKYILVIVDDYSRFTWVKCLISKDEAPDFIIKLESLMKHPLLALHSKCLEPALHEMTTATISSRLVSNPPSSTPFVPPTRTNWDVLFQPMFDELLNPSSSVDPPAPEVIALIAEVVAPEPAASTGSPSSTTVDQDAPSPSNSQTSPETQFLIISNDVEEENHDLDVAYMNNDPFFGILIPKNVSVASSSSNVIPIIVHNAAPNSEHINK